MLDLSTAHLPGPNPDFGKLRNTETEYGFVVFVSPDADKDEVPEWLEPIHADAVKHRAMLINFDNDAGIYNFKLYDW